MSEDQERDDAQERDAAQEHDDGQGSGQEHEGGERQDRGGGRTLTDEERAALLKEQLKRLRVIDVVYDMMVQLVQLGYQKLGLTEETRELRDLDDARVAIEALRRLVEVAEGEHGPEPDSLRATLAQMQLNYARAAAGAEAVETDRADDAAQGSDDTSAADGGDQPAGGGESA